MTMGKRSTSEGFYYAARDTVESQRQTRVKNRNRTRQLQQLQSDLHPQYFVPMFGVRRQVLLTPELEEFTKDLKENLPGNYRVFDARSLAMTIMGQRKVIQRIRDAALYPSEDLVQRAAERTAKELKQSLQGVPRRMTVPLGRVDSFGDEGKRDKVGIIPSGWKGFTARYADRGAPPQKDVLPIPVLIRETNICLGGIASTFGHNEELERGIRLAGLSTTPHVTVAQKVTGGPISHSEMQGIGAIVEECMPESLVLFDPLIQVKLATSSEKFSIPPRSPRLSLHNQ